MESGQSRILVVDDDVQTTDLLTALLSEEGYAVESAGLARAMLERAASSPPDLILLDVMLPDLNGFEALESLRARESSGHTPVIMLTALSDPSFRTRGIRTGADDYISKPFDLDELLSRVALRLHQARQIREQRRSAVSSGLLAISHVATSERIEDVIPRVTAMTRDLLSAKACAIMLWNPEQHSFDGMGATGLAERQEALFKSLRIPVDSFSGVDELTTDARPFWRGPETNDSREQWLMGAFGVDKAMGVPIVYVHELYGMLIVGRESAAKEFGEEDIALLSSVARQAGLALANLRALELLEQQAITDSLTGLYNPQYLREFLSQQLTRARRTGEPTAVLMLDVDHFKQVNDQFGHPAGDRALAAVAAAVRSSVRAADTVARFGGEEFAVVLPGASRREWLHVAQRILRRVREAAIDLDGCALQLTVSAGLAMAGADEDVRALIRAADSALYAAKRAGRDCVR